MNIEDQITFCINYYMYLSQKYYWNCQGSMIFLNQDIIHPSMPLSSILEPLFNYFQYGQYIVAVVLVYPKRDIEPYMYYNVHVCLHETRMLIVWTKQGNGECRFSMSMDRSLDCMSRLGVSWMRCGAFWVHMVRWVFRGSEVYKWTTQSHYRALDCKGVMRSVIALFSAARWPNLVMLC